MDPPAPIFPSYSFHLYPPIRLWHQQGQSLQKHPLCRFLSHGADIALLRCTLSLGPCLRLMAPSVEATGYFPINAN